MAWADIVNIKSNKPTKVFKEGIDYVRNSEPTDIFHRELKELDPVIDKDFVIEVTLLAEDMSNPFEKQYLNIETVFGVGGDVVYKNETYTKNVNARDIVSFILNERTFYTNSYADADRLHLMLYKMVKRIEEFNNSLGVRPISNPTVIEQIRSYVLKLEEDKGFIVIGRIKDSNKETSPINFFKNRQNTIIEKQVSETGGMAGVMNTRASRFDLGNNNGRVFMK